MPFAPDSNVEILNTWGVDDTFLTKRTRTLASGKTQERYTIEVKSEPILVNFDSMVLGAGPAQAIKDLIVTQIQHITADASIDTQAIRAKMAKAYDAGKTYATKRYSGGKTPAARPGSVSSTKLFNDSGRLTKLAVTQNRTDLTYTINAPNNRLDPSTFRSMGAFQNMVSRLKDLVPALDPQKLSSYKDVENAVRASIGDLITKAESIQAAKLKQLAIARKQALVAAGRFVFNGITGRI